MEFKGFPKVPRLSREAIITEKLDGTNAQVVITEDGQLLAGSRNRWITPEADNYGFARWCEENREELMRLGPGQHFGEWWGRGIQRGYGLTERRFSLFNVTRWENNPELPACCSVVPVLYRGDFSTLAVDLVLETMRQGGSYAVPGFMRPEGVVIYHIAAGASFKKLLEHDERPKSQVAA